jgi:hypothetical protein
MSHASQSVNRSVRLGMAWAVWEAGLMLCVPEGAWANWGHSPSVGQQMIVMFQPFGVLLLIGAGVLVWRHQDHDFPWWFIGMISFVGIATLIGPQIVTWALST